MRTLVGYTNLNVKFVGVNAGSWEESGRVTHQFYEDHPARSFQPAVHTIFTPADPAQVLPRIKKAAEIEGPVYVEREADGKWTSMTSMRPLPSGITVEELRKRRGAVLSGFWIVSWRRRTSEGQGIPVTVADINILYGKDRRRSPKVMAERSALHGGGS